MSKIFDRLTTPEKVLTQGAMGKNPFRLTRYAAVHGSGQREEPRPESLVQAGGFSSARGNVPLNLAS